MQDQFEQRRTGRRGFAILSMAALGAGVGIGGWRAAASGGAEERGWCGIGCGGVVPGWSLAAYQAIRAKDGYADPLMASRALAMMHIAMHDAVNAAMPRFAPHVWMARVSGADASVAAAAAAHGVMVAFCPDQKPMLDAELAMVTSEAGRGPAVERGKALGAEAARAVLASRAEDGAAMRAAYAPQARPGRYQYTPGFDFIFHPQWRNLRPFALRSPSQFRVAAPPALDSGAYQRAFEEVKAVGGKGSTRRTEDQTRFAHFWYEFSDIGWNRVARVVARERDLDLWESARMFALVNMALADSYIAGWDSKLHHDFWRPVTAIRLAADDGNPATAPEAGWEPLLPTPPIQDHPSTHSALGAAAAAVMGGLLGDATPFTLTSTSALPENPIRRFASFSSAARENAESRVMAGLHFRFSCEAGLELGERVGRFTLVNHLKAIDRRPA